MGGSVGILSFDGDLQRPSEPRPTQAENTVRVDGEFEYALDSPQQSVEVADQQVYVKSGRSCASEAGRVNILS